MKTYDGLKKISCAIDGTSIIVKGSRHQITELKDMTHTRPLLWILLGFNVFLLVFFIYSFYVDIGKFKIQFDYVEFFFTIVITIGLIVSQYFLITFLTKYRGHWRANKTKPIYIENSDDNKTEALLQNAKIEISKLEASVEKTGPTSNSIKMTGCFIIGIILIFILPFNPGSLWTVTPSLIFIGLGCFFRFKQIIIEASWNNET